MTAPIPKILSWPLEGIDESGKFSYASDDESVREVIRNILLTRPGERIRRKYFGAGIIDFVHENNNVTTRTMMADIVKKAITQWETRVVVEAVDVTPDSQSLARVHIVVRYRMRHTRKSNQLTLSLDLGQF